MLPVVEMNADQALGWLAGFLEGEGSFIYHQRIDPKGKPHNHFIISVQSTDEDALQRVGEMVGNKVHRVHRPRDSAKGWQPIYSVRLQRRNDVVAWCRRLYPLMSARRQKQIEVLLAADGALPRPNNLRPETLRA
jgi:hypothetical protein